MVNGQAHRSLGQFAPGVLFDSHESLESSEFSVTQSGGDVPPLRQHHIPYSQIASFMMKSRPVCEFVPYLSTTDAAKAVAFYSRVFGVDPHLLLNMPDGRVMHCEFRIGNARFFVSEELPEHGGTPSPTRLGGTTVAIHLYVADCDAMVKTMTDNDSIVLLAPVDMFWGDRFARVRDPFGHEWGISTQLREMSPGDIQAAATELFSEMSE